MFENIPYMLIIHAFTFCILICGLKFVLKATGFKNKIMIAMIVMLILAITLHSGYLLILDDDTFLKWVNYTGYALQYGLSSMSIALLINFRIWTQYLLKIFFLSYIP